MSAGTFGFTAPSGIVGPDIDLRCPGSGHSDGTPGMAPLALTGISPVWSSAWPVH